MASFQTCSDLKRKSRIPSTSENWTNSCPWIWASKLENALRTILFWYSIILNQYLIISSFLTLRILYNEYFELNEIEKEFIRDYGRNLGKLLQIQSEDDLNDRDFFSIFKPRSFQPTIPQLQLYHNLMEHEGVVESNGDILKSDDVKERYKGELLRTINILKDSVLVPKICFNVVSVD